MSKNMILSPPQGSKKSTSGKKSAKPPSATKAGSTTTSNTSGHVTISVGAKTTALPVAALDQTAVHDIVEQLGKGKGQAGSIELAVSDGAAWSPSDRGNFWSLYRALRADDTRQVVLRAGGKVFAQPADWAAHGLADTADDPAERCRALDAAADILTNAYRPADQDVYLEVIVGKLRGRGFSAERCGDVKRNIRLRLREAGREAGDVKPGVGGTGTGKPYALARVFLNDHYSPQGAEPAAENVAYSLRYYDESFYRRRAGHWAKATAEDVKLELTSFLQGVDPGQVGTKQVGDAFMNLKALCVVRVDNTPPLPFHVSDPTRRMLAFSSGLLDLTALAAREKPQLLPHDPDWFSPAALPYAFDPEARCPKFRAFVGQILNADPKTLKPLTEGDNRVKVVQELFGYSLLTDNRFQTFAIFTGNGRNGKGTLFDVWGEMIGPENTASVPLEAMCKEFGTEPLVGKMLNLAGDMNDVDAAVEGTLKSWTGEDRVTVPRKYKQALQVEPVVKFIYGCNKLPWFKDKSDGVWRRLIVVPFNYSPKAAKDIDAQLRRKLKKELPGVLNWALRGLARLLEQGQFTECAVCSKAKAEHRDACALVKEFIGNHFTLAAEYAGLKAGKKWMTTATEIKLYVKDYNAKFGERAIASHVVCRELAGMDGVTTQRPTTTLGRVEYGNVYYGVCIGEPKVVIPGDLDEVAKKSGLDELVSKFAADPPANVPLKKSKGAKSAKGVK